MAMYSRCESGSRPTHHSFLIITLDTYSFWKIKTGRAIRKEGGVEETKKEVFFMRWYDIVEFGERKE